MTKLNKKQSISIFEQVDSTEVYQRLVADKVTIQIIQVKQGANLPLKPESNPIELDILKYALEDFQSTIINIESDKGEPNRTIKETQINPNAAQEINRQILHDGIYIKQSGIESCFKYKSILDFSKQEFNAFKQAYGITRPVQTGSKLNALLVTILFLIIDSLFNGIQLFSSNALSGGLIGAIALSGLVSAVNNVSGYICGEYLWRNTLTINKSNWHVTATVGTGVISIAVLIVNGLFAYFRSFGSAGIDALLVAESHVFLSFFGISFIGIIVFLWVGIKWNKTNDPLIRYGNLYNEILKQQSQLDIFRESVLKEVTDWKDYACDQLDDLLDREREDFASADEALEECTHLIKEIDNAAEAKINLYAAVIAHYRSIIVACDFDNLPNYFTDAPHIELHNPIDLNALHEHIDLLKDNLEELTQQVQKCKQLVFEEAEKLSVTLYRQCCEEGEKS